MNNEKLMAKIRRVGKISIAGIILYFVYVVAGAVHGAKNTFVDGFREGWNDYDPEAADAAFTASDILGIISAFLMIGIIIFTVKSAIQLVIGLSKNTSPFCEKISRSTRDLGIGLILSEVISAVLMIVSKMPVDIGFSWLAGVIFYAFSLIFRYGTELQREADETL
ncbi:MAG: hypothetical protein IKN85_09165 [Oscillospiraceae bacterium]|nr:hypothetical protein [Oscillospiraceae bacterium]MBR3535986.1 hypothetical protein [Oscillospiraceae bacterium]